MIAGWALMLASGIAESPSALVQAALGLVLLLFGRRLFWLVIGAVGFWAGLSFAEAYLGPDAGNWRWLAALGLGALGALVAVFLQRLAIGVGGALIAAYSAHWYLALSGEPLSTLQWAVVALAGLAGLLVARLVADLALIALSVLAGATLVLEGIDAEPSMSRWIFVGLLVLGAWVQSASLRRSRGSGDG